MTAAVSPAALDLRERYTSGEARLRGWLAAQRADWDERLREALAQHLVRPAAVRARLHAKHWLDATKPSIDLLLPEGESLIGREEHCRLVLEESVVQREHARVTVRGQDLTIEDLGSRLGTFIGDRKLEPNVPVKIAPGVAFTIFPYTLRLELARDWEREERIRLGSWRTVSYSQPPKGLATAVRLPGSGGELGIYLSRELGTELAAAMLGVESLPGSGALDVDVECFAALLQAVAACLLGEAGEVELRKPVFAGPALLLEGAVELRGKVGTASVVLPESVVASWREARPPHAPMHAVPFLCQALLAEVELPPADAAAIEPGDIVLCDAEPALLLPGDAGCWQCTAGDSNFSRLEINKWLGQRVATTETNTKTLSELPVRLHVILAEKEFTLGELETLAAGSIIELGREDSEPVALALNGRRMGRGELVRVDGKLGVRVVDWHA